MPDVAKLKKKAAEFELKKQFDKALAVYVEILDGYDKARTDEDVDVGLYNRVGDLYLKQGNVADAVDYYEKAVDRYSEGGFFNNAIALCNKILRNSPGRATVYYKLGKISAQKGFKSDAKANFLEYADRMQQAGNTDESFRALKEFADLCPDQDDIRLMLAEQLSRKERGSEAIEQLQLLYDRYLQEGREMEARATVTRMQAIDPAIEPRSGGRQARSGAPDLVFLDLSDSATSTRQSAVAKRATHGLDIIDVDAPPTRLSDAPEPERIAPAPPSAAVEASPAPTAELLDTLAMEPALLDGITRAAELEHTGDVVSSGGLVDGLEVTSLTPGDVPISSGSLLDFEPTSFGETSTAEDAEALDLELFAPEEPSTTGDRLENPTRPSLHHLPVLVDEHADGATSTADAAEDDGRTIGGELELIMPDDRENSGGSIALDDIPLMDLDLPVAGEASFAIEARPPEAQGDVLRIADELETPINADEWSLDSRTPASAPRSSTIIAEHSVEMIQALVDADPEDNALRRRLAEAMLDSGDREGGVRQLEAAMVGYERADDLMSAFKVADEIVLINPESVRHHQKRVEYAFRTNERGRLIEAYLQLADALFRAGQVEKSRAIYQRVIDLSPDDARAMAALESFDGDDESTEPSATSASTEPVAAMVTGAPIPAPVASSVARSSRDDEYVNLGDWLRDDEPTRDTRMVVEEKEPTGDEEADFQDMLRKFKQGIAENVEEEDHQSHYDLGVAYKEMGLLDEAIAEFQKALRAPANRVSTYETLGQCFIEKAQYPMAATVLQRALHEPGVGDDQLVGVLYLLGLCAEQRGQHEAALGFYQRVFVIDIQFRDIGERLAAVDGTSA